jgi:two-component system, cell cycle sensor histidine kinase and response regulator CckA
MEHRMKSSPQEHDVVIRKLNQDIAALQKEKAESGLLRQAFLEMPQDMVFIVDKSGKYVFVNNAAASSLDTAPDAMIGKSIRDFTPHDVARYLERHVDKVFETGEPFVNEMPFLLPPRHLWVYERMIPVRGASGEVLSVAIITHDITDQKLAENALRESEERFRQIIEQMPYPVEIFSPDGTAVMANSAFLDMMKIPSTDLIIGKFNLFSDPFIGQIGIADQVRKAFNGSTVFLSDMAFPLDKIDKKYCVGEKETIFLETTFFPVYLQPGELFHVVAIFKDVTERRLIEIALQENERKMRTQYKCFPLPTYTYQSTGDDFIFVDYNDAAIHFTAGGAQKLLGKRLSEIFRHDPKVIADMKRCLHEKTVFTVESPHVFPISKTEKYLNVTYVFVEPDLVMVHTVDVTEKQKMEREIRRAEHLESIGLLASGIAHDFNNLLAGVFGYIGLAREYGKANDNVKDSLDKAMLVFGQAKALTQQLLTFSKGGSPVRKLASIAELLRDMSSFVLAGTDVKPEFSIPEDLWACEVDTGQLSEVINNLLINAQQAMPDGGVIRIAAENLTVEDRRELRLGAGRYVEISIRDHGIGIPSDQLNRIFDPFYSTKQQGSGLGLTIAYSIIKKHDGHLDISSQVGVGTVARILLPASHESIKAAADPMENLIRGQGRILLMDDEEFLLDALAKIIRTLGYTVDTVHSGLDAIAMYRQAELSRNPFDAVILDLTVPGGMGGKQAMQEMHRLYPDVKAIATSGYSEDPVIADPTAFGFRGALRKPYSIEELSAVLDKVLSEP